ncbi:hypothetical protein GGQ91_001981 [Methylobacterium fujisawaense]|uniref:Secreted protein n=1 Tax=Methylobacterium fujisawaense TaxID=107400 RepID=A0ABR6D937_9HYPH|nr:hypothetical protein [Methylobacterium fujisawaense]
MVMIVLMIVLMIVVIMLMIGVIVAHPALLAARSVHPPRGRRQSGCADPIRPSCRALCLNSLSRSGAFGIGSEFYRYRR